MSDSHKKQIEHDAAGRHAAGRHGASTGKHVAAHASNDAGAHGPSRRTLAIALPIAGALVAGGIALVATGTVSLGPNTDGPLAVSFRQAISKEVTPESSTAIDAAKAGADATKTVAENAPADDMTPLETGGKAKVVKTKTSQGIQLNAPEGFDKTPTCENLDAAVKAFREKGYNLGFVMIDLKTGRSATYDADRKLYPASCVKAIYCTAIAEANGGFGGSASTAQDCIVNSSNDAYHSLISSYGLPTYASWLEAHGAKDAGSMAYVHFYPDMTANELASSWRGIYDFCKSDKPGASQLAEWLGSSNHTPLGGLLRPGGTKVWAKPGWYPADGSGKVATNDAGIVFSDCGDYLCVVMSDASEDFDSLFPVIDALNAAHGKMCSGHSAPLFTDQTKLPGM